MRCSIPFKTPFQKVHPPTRSIIYTTDRLFPHSQHHMSIDQDNPTACTNDFARFADVFLPPEALPNENDDDDDDDDN